MEMLQCKQNSGTLSTESQGLGSQHQRNPRKYTGYSSIKFQLNFFAYKKKLDIIYAFFKLIFDDM